MNDTQRILAEARKLIENESNWVKNRLATAADGSFAAFCDDAAARFCADGALAHVQGEYTTRTPAFRALDDAAGEINGGGPYATSVGVNDAFETTHADVLRMYDRAIEIAGEA